ncbi:MAG: DUF2948 family protein [Alphaproteobacteria bacterium]|nr:DUF2948 family protein [Alphaproteobacteria bacterium]
MVSQLKLRAMDTDDLGVISAVLQDGLVTFGDMEFLPEEQRFVLVVNRFCWECGRETGEDPRSFERVHSGVCFNGVKSVRYRNLDRKNRANILELLAVKPENGLIDLLFAGRGRVRLEVERVECYVQDLDEPWPTAWRPHHPVSDGT